MGRVLVILLAIAALSPAATITFDVILSGTQEVPPVATPGTGTATVVVDDVLNTVEVDLEFSGLLSATTNAHIHCCNGPGVNSPVVIPFLPAGFAVGTTSGTFSALFTGVSPSVVAGIASYGAYVNIHSGQFPGGEIRADLVPEPGTLALLGLGLGGLAASRGVRKRLLHR